MSDYFVIRSSGLQLYQKCPYAWYLRFIEGLKQPPGWVALVGSAAHKAIQEMLLQKALKGTLPEFETVATIAEESLKERAKETEIHKQKDDLTLDGNIQRAMRLATAFRSDVAPKIETAMIEGKPAIEMEIQFHPKGYDIDVSGHIDHVSKTGIAGESMRVDDWKTTGAKPKQLEADRSPQLTAYGLGVMVKTGKLPTEYSLVKLWTHGNKCDTITLPTTRGKNDFRALQMLFEDISKSIQYDHFPAADPNHWICSPKWCGYYPCPKITGSDKIY